MELRCLCKCLLKHLMVRRFLRESGREFQTDDPENARLVLYWSMRGCGGIKLLEPYLLEDLVKSERMYSGVFPLRTLNIITALIYFSYFVNGRSLRVFSLSSVGIDGPERMSFAARLDGRHCNHPTEWRHSIYEIKCAHYRTACVL